MAAELVSELIPPLPAFRIQKAVISEVSTCEFSISRHVSPIIYCSVITFIGNFNNQITSAILGNYLPHMAPIPQKLSQVRTLPLSGRPLGETRPPGLHRGGI